MIPPCGPWRYVEAVAFATLEWIDWSSNRRLLELISNIPPALRGTLLGHTRKASHGGASQSKQQPGARFIQLVISTS